MMYVPGNDEKKVSKIPSLGADCICLDCEDGVALSKKAEARKNIRKILEEKSIEFGRSECSVRVNSVESGIMQEDIKIILQGNANLPQAIHLPKVDEPSHLDIFVKHYNEALSSTKSALRGEVGLIIFVESARSLVRLAEICQQAVNLSSMSNLVPQALVFGSDDFVADIGATRTKNAIELVRNMYCVMFTHSVFRF
jgi:citrate lyase subunit beta-like protein